MESIIEQKKALMKNSKDVHESDRLFSELDSLEWLQRQLAVYALFEGTVKEGVKTKI